MYGTISEIDYTIQISTEPAHNFLKRNAIGCQLCRYANVARFRLLTCNSPIEISESHLYRGSRS